MNKLRLILAACLLMLAGCNDRGRLEALEKRMEAAEKSHSDIVAQLTKGKEDIEDLKFLAAAQELIKDGEKMAVLTPGDSGYSLFKSDIGTLSVKIMDIKPYADGSKLIVKIGNLSAATINGLKVDVDWGPMTENGEPDDKKTKTRSFQFEQPIQRGAWSTQTITLSGVPTKNVGFIRFKNATHSGISLIG